MRKFIVLMLSGVMLSSSISVNAIAVTEKAATIDAVSSDNSIAIIKGEPIGSKASPSKEALETAIMQVKAKISIPSQYSEFNYYFNDAGTYSDASWTMSWSTKDGNAHITVTCDTAYRITSFYRYDYTKPVTGISKYLKSELKKTSDDFIEKVSPGLGGKLEFMKADFDSVYNGNYIYQYQRVENGIAFPENTVQVNVNSITGEVSAFYLNWLHGAKLPSKTTEITKEEATKLIKENMKMKLVYRSDYYSIYDVARVTKKKAFLVYEPTQSYISIDAKSGKVYLAKSEWVNTRTENESAKNTAAADSSAGSGNMTLTEEEMAKIKELNNIISKEKAIQIITGNTSLYLDENLTAHSTALTKLDRGDGKSKYVWNISLSDPREINYEKDKSYYRGHAYATVDAVSGKILSFNASVKSYYDEISKKWQSVKISYNQKQAKEILEKFLKQQANDRFTNSVLVNSNEDYVVTYKNNKPVFGGYQYQYNRVHQSIEYPYNSIYGSVDGVTGKIYSFGSNWDENIEFESPKGAMTADAAMDAYLSKDGYDLKYEINQITKYDDSKKTKDLVNNNLTSVEYEVRLVYQPGIEPSYISPFTGEQLNGAGEVYKKEKPYQYQDLKDDTKYRNVLLLADMNIGFEGENFLPNQAITVGELNELLDKIGAYYPMVIKNATKDNRLITREEIALTFIEKLGLLKVANIKGIYKTGFADEGTIQEKYLGAVALAKGYGLMNSDKENKFNPKNNVNRLEAVDLVLSYIEVQRNGIY